MHPNTVILYLAVWLQVSVFASPLPFKDIERRWSKGESENLSQRWTGPSAEIHAHHHIREASPAWLVARDAEAEAIFDENFTYATDERTMAERSPSRRVVTYGKRSETSGSAQLRAKMIKFVSDFMMKKDGKGMIAAREEETVALPRRGWRYHFQA